MTTKKFILAVIHSHRKDAFPLKSMNDIEIKMSILDTLDYVNISL